VDRNVTAQSVHREGEVLLFDCGEGTQRQMMRYGVGFSFRELFITHYHSDHILGLPGLVRTMGLLDRTEPMIVYGPRGGRQILGDLLKVGVERNKFPVEIVEVEAGDVLRRKEYDLEIFPTDHRAGSVGYALREHLRLGRFDPDRARAMGIPEGPLWGRIHRGERIDLPDGRSVDPSELVGPTRPGRTVVLTGDTRPSDAVRQAAQGADLLVHDATSGDEERVRAAETGHSTARPAAQVARDAGVRRLARTHLSARYSRDAPELLAEAREAFAGSLVARDGLTLDIPFPDDADATV
jgi:ribonuclease Z